MKTETKKEVGKIVKLLKSGAVIVYPTDTIWGIGCDATNTEAIKKLIRIKKRPRGKSMLLLADHISLAEMYTENIPDAAQSIAEESIEPITIIYPKGKNLAKEVLAEDESIGIRITEDPFCQLIIQQLNRPIVSTSANISGEKAPTQFSEISKVLIDKVDYVANHRRQEILKNKPSSIIKISDSNEVTILRK
ncbi:MAG: L-threonylcarbamoyladenylate synthase [Bacteroidota bacterium]|nr:L-threonylcarbamoyladenylate synthase [Bacteroidota bacterium]